MTSIGPVIKNKIGQKADPLKSTTSQFDINKKQIDNSPEENFKKAEKEINALIEASATLAMQQNLGESLEKAKEAYNKEKNLRR